MTAGHDRILGAVIVGTGFGVLTHLRALRKADIEVRALVGRDPEKTRDRARRCGVPLALTSLEEALALPGVDIVTIATPPHTHAAIAIAAAQAGKHIFCEKPFARDAQEARAMLDAAEAAGVVHLLGTEFRGATGQALATRAIRQGAIGEPRLATFMMHVPVLADPRAEVPAWWASAADGGGWLGAYAPHLIDQVLATFGPIVGVSASLSLIADHPWSAEDSFTVHFRTASGVAGIMQSTAGSWGPMLVSTRFTGTAGTLWLEGERVRVADAGGVRELPVPEDLLNPPPEPVPAEFMHTTYDYLHAAGFDLAPCTRLFRAMRDRILGLPAPDDPAPATFADGLAGQRVLDAIRRSAQSGEWIAIGSD
ncbi:MAG: Gfo/Idh/MocA family oxidoreductase [Rubrivivax sp.]|nr:Gfo/Idh/MocA family oxidoreductase [Rubrivivax sp.]